MLLDNTRPLGIALASLALGLPAQAQFVDVAQAVGLGFVGADGATFPGIPAPMMQRAMGNGAAVGDYDGDGDLDVYLLTWEGTPNVLLQNNLDTGQADFTDVTVAAGVGDLGLGRVAHFVDLDDDGLLDLLVLNDNDLAGSHPPSKLFRNDGDGSFTDVTASSGFAPLGFLRCGASLADYDLDGLLDIYVSAWTAAGTPVGPPTPAYPGENKLYRNLGNFSFQDVTDAVGLGGMSTNSFTAIFHDFDEDDRPDLYVAVDFFTDEFYWNTPAGFVKDTLGVGATHLANDMGAACMDYDNDGDLDIYTTNINSWAGSVDPGNCLYRNSYDTTGTTAFTNAAGASGIDDTYWGWGVEFSDFDNDGNVDIVAATGFDELINSMFGPTHPLYKTPMVFFQNTGTGTFIRTEGSDTDDSRALVAFDYDRDGDEDLLVTNVNGPLRLWENVGQSSGHWLQVAVRQVTGNHFGVGVTIEATIGAVTQRREILAGESYLAGTPAEVHFGLGQSTSVDELRIKWTDGTQSVYTNVPVDQLLTIFQGALQSYGCGTNPAGGLTVLSGTGAVGTNLVFGLTNPVGTQAAGSLPLLGGALGPATNYPCGTPLPGWGMSAPYIGEWLLDTKIIFVLVGPLWNGTDPSPIGFGIPSHPLLPGVELYMQGLMIDDSPGALVPFGLTGAIELSIGS